MSSRVLDWSQKAEALAALAELSIKYRDQKHRIGKSEPWYVDQNIEIKDGNTLIGVYGNGHDPHSALADHWNQLVTNLEPQQYLIARPEDGFRRSVRWNGFMWADVRAPKKEAE